MVKKLDLYMSTGIKEYWVVDPNAEHIIIYSFEDSNIDSTNMFKKNEKLESLIYPEFQLEINEIFA